MPINLPGRFELSDEVTAALSADLPVVALESTLISHGLPAPHNLQTAHNAQRAVRDAGAVPATIAVIDGVLRVGLDDKQLDRLASDKAVTKLSRRDLPWAIASKACGTTTVAATIIAAQKAGIKVFATGGIGGVHRGLAQTLDISADLAELARGDILVVCSGAKAILDLERTHELLETLGVAVLGYRCDFMPGFWTKDTKLPVDRRIDELGELAAIDTCRRELGITSGMLLCNPVPAEHELDAVVVDGWIAAALAAARAANVHGKKITPYLLADVAKQSDGKTLKSNIALIVANAQLAAQAATVLTAQSD